MRPKAKSTTEDGGAGGGGGRGGDNPYYGLYGQAPPERGTFFKLQVYEKLGI